MSATNIRELDAILNRMPPRVEDPYRATPDAIAAAMVEQAAERARVRQEQREADYERLAICDALERLILAHGAKRVITMARNVAHGLGEAWE